MSPTLLVVDDNANYRALVRHALKGTEVVVVGEAADAATGIAEAARLAPDLILLDVVMDRMDGLSAIKPMRDAAPGACIVTVSSYAEHELWGRPPTSVRVAYISKALPPRLLAEELERVLARHRKALAGDTVVRESRRFPPVLQTAREARRFVSDTLRTWRCDELVDSVCLLVSELVTNSVIHAHSDVDLVLNLHREMLRVEVIDAADEGVHRRAASDDDQSGRGMALIEAIASSWGIDSLLEGKSVWFEMSLTGEAE